MCGIVAIWSPTTPVLGTDLAPIELLRHRGPDAVTRWVSPTGIVGLAHARLAVVGLANGDQPVTTPDSAIQAVVNGELYGYRALRAELTGRGHRFSTTTDSELVPHLYEEDPSDLVSRMRGEFAVVLWDERRRRLLAVRDRFGVKPLYYTWLGRRLVLASEVKALFAAGAPRRWDAESFHDYLHACFGPERTLFGGIFQVPPGGMLCVDDGGARIVRYWEPDYPCAGELPDGGVDSAAMVEQVRAEVEEAVRLRLVADVPVGFHLSGGLDSSAVAGVAARWLRPRTFTVRFPDTPRDEGDVAARTAMALGADHQEVRFGPELDPEMVLATAVTGEMVQENGHGTARYRQSAALRRNGLRVALAGEGGDELFAGYGHLRTDLELSADPERMARVRRSYARLTAGPVPATLLGTLERIRFLPGWLVDRCMTVTLPIQPLLRAEFRARFAGRDSLAGLIDGAGHQLTGRAPVHQSLYLFLRSWFCNYILAAERLDMAHGVEVRLPLLDHHLFRRASRLPLVELRRGGGKQPFRDAMRPYLTEEVYAGEKRPFLAPPSAKAADIAALLLRRIDDGDFDGAGFFDPAATRAFLRGVGAATGVRQEAGDRLLYIVASVAALQSAYGLSPD